MKVLLLTDDVWSDSIHTNNVLTNWFEGFPAEFANIYLATGIPENNCCRKYYQITDTMMFLSIVTPKKAGRSFELNRNGVPKGESLPERENKAFYVFMKLIATETIRLLRDLIWLSGKYNVAEISQFIQEFDPDIIFSMRLANRKMLRFERMILGLTNRPMIAFTGDDEYSLLQLRFSPIYWFRRICLRKDLRRTVPCYRKYYMLSEQQAKLYKQIFHVDTELLMKCSDFTEEFHKKEIHTPIRMVYTGKLYCNRWKTLIKIKEALEKLNHDEIRMVMEIYTKDRIPKRRRKQLSDGKNSFLMPPADAKSLIRIYQQADIALHVEAFDIKNRWITKYSLSTKIIDCLSSSCALIAICPEQNAGYQYLKSKNAAICINSISKLDLYLRRIADRPQLLYQYQKKAWNSGKQNHSRLIIQEKLYQDMVEICEGSEKSERSSNEDSSNQCS